MSQTCAGTAHHALARGGLKNALPSSGGSVAPPPASHLKPFLFICYLVLGLSWQTILAQETLCDRYGGETYTILNTAGQTTFTSNLPVNWSWSEQNYSLGGTLVVNSEFPIYKCKFKMGNNASIQTANSGNVGVTYSKFFACGNDQWNGFLTPTGSTGRCVILWSEVEDAKNSFEVQSAAAFLTVYGCMVNQNKTSPG